MPQDPGETRQANLWKALTKRLSSSGVAIDGCLQFALHDVLEYDSEATREVYVRAAIHTARLAEIARALASDNATPNGDWDGESAVSIDASFPVIFRELVRASAQAAAEASNANPLMDALMPELLPVLLRVMTKLGAQAQAEAQRRAEQAEENDGGD